VTPAEFARRIVAWQRRHGRHDLPWQRPATPYRVWVSEVMLQQTQVATVIPYFERFVARFPDVAALAAASVDEVLALWAGLGYYARARSLHRAARIVAERHGGELPASLEALVALPGIGRSTAGAILALAHGLPFPILDGNAKRVLARFHAVDGWPGEANVARRLWALAEASTPRRAVRAYTQGIMDLGATVCARTAPRCDACPVREGCAARRSGAPERWPAPRPRRALPEREARMLLVTDPEGRVLLARRPPAGVWGGLWCLPEVPEGEAPIAWARRALGLELRGLRELAPLRHTFTHFRLLIRPLRGELAGADPTTCVMEGDGRLWYKVRARRRPGMPAPVARLIERHLWGE